MNLNGLLRQHRSLKSTKQLLSFILSTLLLLFLMLIFAHTSYADDIDQQHKHVLITFKHSIDTQLIESHGGQIDHEIPMFQMVSATLPISDIPALKNNPDIATITEDDEVSLAGQTEDEGIAQMLPQRSNYPLTGKGVRVAVIDTGVDKSHPDLHIAGGTNILNSSDPSDYQDDNGHGTEVAGVIGAQDNSIGVVGVAPNVELYAVKALDAYGVGHISDMIAAISWCIHHNIDIMNFSFSSPDANTYLQQAIQMAAQKGILMVGAAGNSGSPNADTVEYPAKYNEVIAVGAVDNTLKRADFSGAGNTLEVTAPGVNIRTTARNKSYSTVSGTSFSTPMVSGLLALYKEAYPADTAAQIRNQLDTHVRDLGTKGRDALYGYGLPLAPSVKATSLNGGFLDISDGYWAKRAIDQLTQRTIISGYQDHYFQPEAVVTRAQSVAMIGRALQWDGTLRPTPFNDVASSNFASGYIMTAMQKGMVKGFSNGTFQPDKPLTRGESALLLSRAYTFPVYKTTAFTDVPAGELAQAVETLSRAGIIEGYKDHTFKPYNKVTRAEFASLLARILDKTES
ncbi:S8 family peptidase [Pullulanibacillus camelliae]|nr:S8 family serine peptidase [Pullulanibacillus camelliae]